MFAPGRFARLPRRTVGVPVSAVIWIALAGTHALAAGPPKLLFPVLCEIGRECWHFAYMDLLPGPAYRDYHCGLRTYEGHKGTDIAPVDPEVRLPVVAAADGVVAGLRDGMDDAPMQAPEPVRAGRECGNGVRLDHGSGWTTQYCHLQRGSIRVRKGAQVVAGDVLGRTGSSGWAELPHLHFQVERNGRPVDPFSGAQATDPSRCDMPASGGERTGLWRNPELAAGYLPAIMHRAGLTTEVPEKRRAYHGGYPRTAPTTAPALVGYVVLLGAFWGTVIETSITGPDGRILFRHRRSINENRARYFAYAGKHRKSEEWEPGVYRAEFAVTEDSPAGPFQLEGGAEITLR